MKKIRWLPAGNHRIFFIDEGQGRKKKEPRLTFPNGESPQRIP
jgi:hypothetical protein